MWEQEQGLQGEELAAWEKELELELELGQSVGEQAF